MNDSAGQHLCSLAVMGHGRGPHHDPSGVRLLSLSSFLLPLLISAVDLTLWSYSLSRDISACVWILNLFCSFVILPIASE
jgi:hypothetical protein